MGPQGNRQGLALPDEDDEALAARLRRLAEHFRQPRHGMAPESIMSPSTCPGTTEDS
jgi:predicted transcriptional regulator